MSNNQAKDLFQLQAELIDMKVDMVVGKAIDRVIEQLNGLKNEMHDLRNDMHNQISGLRQEMHTQISGLRQEMHNGFLSLDKRVVAIEVRVVAIETRLGMVGEKRKGIYDRVMDYLFKATWGASTLIFAYLIVQFHIFIK